MPKKKRPQKRKFILLGSKETLERDIGRQKEREEADEESAGIAARCVTQAVLSARKKGIEEERDRLALKGLQTEGKATPGPGSGDGAGEAIRTPQSRFTFQSGVAYFDGNVLKIPTGRAVEVLKKLHKSFGKVVPHSDLHGQSDGHEAQPELRDAIRKIRKALKKIKKFPCELKNIPREGYLLHSRHN